MVDVVGYESVKCTHMCGCSHNYVHIMHDCGDYMT